MKDQRLYAKFVQDFPDDPKIRPLSDAAFRCWVEAICWSRQHMTDGHLPNRLARARWSLDALAELCANDPQKPSFEETENGWYIHDYGEHQVTKADMLARQEHAKEAGRRGGLARAKQTAKHTAKQNGKQTVSKVLSKTVAEKEKEREIKEGGARAPARETPPNNTPPPTCSKHPNGWDHDERCRTCQHLREWHEAATAQETRQRQIANQQRIHAANTARLDAIERCHRENPGLCDEVGIRRNNTVCDHIDRTDTHLRGMAEVRAALRKPANQPAVNGERGEEWPLTVGETDGTTPDEEEWPLTVGETTDEEPWP